MTNRREFIGAVAAGSGLAFAAPEPQPWFDRPMRWAQLTLVENDPGQYDPNFWLDYFRRTHSDAACLRRADAWLIIRRRSRCIIAARGWAIGMRLENCWRDAGS
jgi:hypothetical protein